MYSAQDEIEDLNVVVLSPASHSQRKGRLQSIQDAAPPSPTYDMIKAKHHRTRASSANFSRGDSFQSDLSGESEGPLRSLESGDLSLPPIESTISTHKIDALEVERSRHTSVSQMVSTAASKLADVGTSLYSLVVGTVATESPSNPLSSPSEPESMDNDSFEQESRVMYLNRPDENIDFCDNNITTAKYTKANFIPRFFLGRLSQTANFYFLLVGVGQIIPAISSTSGLPYQWIVLGIVISIDAVFAAIEDNVRHRADAKMNAKITRVFDAQPGEPSSKSSVSSSHEENQTAIEDADSSNSTISCFSEVMWKDVCVGDVLKINNYEFVPADILLLAVSETNPEQPAGICFVETKSLDGETNLKIRQALGCTFSQLYDPRSLGHLPGRVIYELPNHDVNNFSGRYEPRNGHTIPFDLKNVVLRGSIIRNTPYVYGVVLNTGSDTKIMQSGSEAPVKRSKIIATVNRGLGILITILLILCILGSVYCSVWVSKNYDRATYLYLGDLSGIAPFRNDFVGWLIYIGYYWILIASFVPITLYVTIAIVKSYQTLFLNRDLAMYDELTDTPALVRNADLNDDLGQVTHIFSDKTGTLTANVMDFRKMSINGISYGYGSTEIGREAQRRLGKDLSQSDLLADQLPHDKHVDNVHFVDPTSEFAHARDTDTNADQSAKIKQFLVHLAVCHSVVLEQARPAAKSNSIVVPKKHRRTHSAVGESRRGKVCSRKQRNNPPRKGSSQQPRSKTLSLVASEQVLTGSSSNAMSILCEPASKFSASSPDELALVSAAKYFGYQFVTRRNGSLTIQVASSNGQEEMTFEILEMIEFSSARKRMSVIVRTPAREILLLTKGADAAIFPRLDTSKLDAYIVPTTINQLERYASEGLRTLVLAERKLDESMFLSWSEKYKAALSDLNEMRRQTSGESNKIDELEDALEQNLQLLGATAIEDRLQDHVARSIGDLAHAGLKIWMLTGDKEETAINIGFACQLLRNDMERLIINTEAYPTSGSLYDFLYETAKTARLASSTKSNLKEITGNTSMEQAIVIDGKSLTMVFAHNEISNLFLDVSQFCCAVICCRVSPKQKAQVVRLFKSNVRGCRTLAIGDGANDVGMIQEAHIGVGISGHEGMQAVNASDFAIAQFRFLKRLLLVHGHWNYRRMAKLCLYCVYKNIILYCTCFVLATLSGGSGTLYFNNMWLNGYNLLWSSLPIAVVAVFEQESPAYIAENFPSLYYVSAQGDQFNLAVFTQWILEALYEGTVCALVPAFLIGHVDSRGASLSIGVCGGMAWCAMITVGWVKLALNIVAWNFVTVFSFVFSFVFWYISGYIISVYFTTALADVAFPYIYTLAEFYLVVYLCLVLCLGRDFLYKAYKREFRPEYYHILQEVHLRNLDHASSQWKPPPVRYQHFKADLNISKPDFVAIEKSRVTSPIAAGRAPTSATRAVERERAYTGFAFSTQVLEDRFIHPLRDLVVLPVVQMVDSLGQRLVDVLHSNGPLTRERIEASGSSMPFEQKIKALPVHDQVVYEVQRYQIFNGWGSSVPGHLFVVDPPQFTNAEMTDGSASFDLTDFVIDSRFGRTDQWQYATKFKDFLQDTRAAPTQSRLSLRRRNHGSTTLASHSERKRLRKKLNQLVGRCVRRRRWVRKERLVQEVTATIVNESKQALEEVELESIHPDTE
uniref:Phospholipid-transporting ATPase n=1 Tax=Albugo laibachii Nc14 TaxID=890382 RepID=F0W1J0_9STRA|nr:phospholipidtransporting ATPase putative [Albugo laibachii Nc14]|eukprot:CCA14919.1 phospholipidtransporting ATPase putative [Albugo laibachii Nc14]